MNDARSITVMSALTLLVGGLVAGCSSWPGNADTITLSEAEQRTEDYARQALAVFPARARSEVDLKETGPGCGDGLFDTSGQENATLRFQIHGLRVSEYPKYFNRLEHWWFDNDFRVQDDERPTRESIVVDNVDGFQMHILHEEGELLLITISPCVWPDGTPE